MPFKVIQGHRDRYQSKARMRLPIVINANWHPIPYTELSQIIVEILDTSRFWAPFRGELRGNVRCLS